MDKRGQAHCLKPLPPDPKDHCRARRFIFPKTSQNERAFKLLSEVTKNTDRQDNYDILVLEKPGRHFIWGGQGSGTPSHPPRFSRKNKGVVRGLGPLATPPDFLKKTRGWSGVWLHPKK